jgi:signal peptidase I
MLILVVVGFEFVRSNFGTYSIVEGDSMYPTFRPNDIVQARKSYVKSERGDVVIVTDDRGDRVIKRVLGLPGETVTFYGGCVYVDGQRLSEPYLAPHTFTFKSDIRNERPEDWRLGENQYFVLGDNRIASRDSRNFGPVERGDIRQVVSLPENAPRPGFCGIVFSRTQKGVAAKYSPGRNPARNPQLTSNSKT